MSGEIAIVDYQMGNLRSVQKAIEHVGGKARITSDFHDLDAADKVILPGVGAFGDAMAELRKRQLVAPIVESIEKGKPFLGICLGLQLLFDVGDEGGQFDGLGVLRGRVQRFSGDAFSGNGGLKVPHMGWNNWAVRKADCPLLVDIRPDDYFYFVHSYYVHPADPNDCWLECDYGGAFCAAIWRENLFATQFHPEKSQAAGLKLLKNFVEL